MAKRKAAKKATKPKKTEQKMASGMPEKKGLPIIPIIGAIIVIVILGGFLILGSLDDEMEDVDFGVPEVGIDILETPMIAQEGEQITLTWRVLGTSVDSSELVYSQIPKGGFGNDFDTTTLEVDGSGYEGITEGQSVESDFEGQTYSATITPEYLPIFMRIHAKSGTTNYWTDEVVVMGQ